ncbi:MAG: hypothetical protein WBH36_16715, partial [Syntrophobacteria bacterium]
LQTSPQDAAAQETWPTASGQPQGIFAAACVEREAPTRSYSAPMTGIRGQRSEVRRQSTDDSRQIAADSPATNSGQAGS